jgi:hypothetical protein
MLKEMKKRQRFSKIQVMSSYSLLNQIAQKWESSMICSNLQEIFKNSLPMAKLR